MPVSPQCPQEISLLTLPVFQGAAVSSEHFSQFFPPGNVAELRGSLSLWGSLKWPSPAGSLLQSTELAALSTPEASLERLVPVVDYLVAWRLLLNVSRWVLHTVEQAIAASSCHLSSGSLPRWWVMAGSGNGTRSKHSPEEGGHRGGPSSRQRVRVLQQYFFVPGKGVASFVNLSLLAFGLALPISSSERKRFGIEMSFSLT